MLHLDVLGLRRRAVLGLRKLQLCRQRRTYVPAFACPRGDAEARYSERPEYAGNVQKRETYRRIQRKAGPTERPERKPYVR